MTEQPITQIDRTQMQRELSDDVTKMCEELGIKQEVGISGIISLKTGRTFHINYTTKFVTICPGLPTDPEERKKYNAVVNYLLKNGYNPQEEGH